MQTPIDDDRPTPDPTPLPTPEADATISTSLARRAGKAVLLALPVLGFLWAVASFFLPKPAAAPLIDVNYIHVIQPALESVARGDFSALVRPEDSLRIIEEGRWYRLRSAFGPRQPGLSVFGATFLVVRNRDGRQVTNLEFLPRGAASQQSHLGKNDGVALCARIVDRDRGSGPSSIVAVNALRITMADGSTTTVTLKPIPDVVSMAPLSGSGGSIRLGFPTVSTR